MKNEGKVFTAQELLQRKLDDRTQAAKSGQSKSSKASGDLKKHYKSGGTKRKAIASSGGSSSLERTVSAITTEPSPKKLKLSRNAKLRMKKKWSARRFNLC